MRCSNPIFRGAPQKLEARIVSKESVATSGLLWIEFESDFMEPGFQGGLSSMDVSFSTGQNHHIVSIGHNVYWIRVGAEPFDMTF